MANTVIVPEVFSDAVNARLGVKLRAAKLATDCTDMVDDITTYGDTVHFPTIDRIGPAEVATKGTPLTPDEVNMSDATAQIKQVAKSVRIYDKDSVQVKGAIKDKMATQVADELAVAVDADLVNAIKTEAVYKDDVAVADFTQTKVNEAFNVFGDDVDNDTFAGILINSRLRSYIMSFDCFTDATKTYNGGNGNGIVRDGVIGYWYGTIPVVISDNGTYDSATKKALLAIVKKDALGIIWQKQPNVEEARAALHLATDIVASELYATKLMRTDGVSVLNVTLA